MHHQIFQMQAFVQGRSLVLATLFLVYSISNTPSGNLIVSTHLKGLVPMSPKFNSQDALHTTEASINCFFSYMYVLICLPHPCLLILWILVLFLFCTLYIYSDSAKALAFNIFLVLTLVLITLSLFTKHSEVAFLKELVAFSKGTSAHYDNDLPSLHRHLNGDAQTQEQSLRARLSLLSLTTSAFQWLQSAFNL